MNEEKLYKALERLLAAVMLMRNGCHERDWLNPYWDGPIQ